MTQQSRSAGITILNRILGEIKLDPGLIKENNEVLHDFLKNFVDEMKEADEIFEFLYRESYFTGSFYSDLRISRPDEYDINFVLDIPLEDHEFRVTHQLQEPNFVTYYRTIPSPQYDGTYRRVFLFENGFLIPELVRNWFQSVVAKALESYVRPRTIHFEHVRQGGPAQNITIVKNNGETIDVDLVPVIGCTLGMSKMSMDRRVEAIVGTNLEAFLIPKPAHSLSDRTAATEVRCWWRCHFPESEEVIIYKKGCAKSVIKLLKLLRDEEQWSILTSYYLKTVVMWMIVENSEIQDFWREDKIAERFLQALIKLANYVEQKKIPYIFNTNCNLIEKIGHQEAYNISNRLNFFIRNISHDINYLIRIF